MKNNILTTQESQIISGALSGRALLGFITDRIAHNDVDALDVAMEVTMRRPVEETSIFPGTSYYRQEPHSYFSHAHSVWSAALVNSLVHARHRPTGFVGAPELTSANLELNVSQEMKAFFKRCSLALMEHVGRSPSRNVVSAMIGTGNDRDRLESAGQAVAFMAAMLNDVDLYKTCAHLVKPKKTKCHVLLELRPTNAESIQEKHDLLSLKNKYMAVDFTKPQYYDQWQITPAFAALAFSSLDVFHEAIKDQEAPYRLKLSSTSSSDSMPFSLFEFLDWQENPLERDVLLNLILHERDPKGFPNAITHFAMNMSRFESKALIPGLVNGIYKDAFEDILKTCPDIIREHAQTLFELGTYSCSPLVVENTIGFMEIPPVAEGAWFPVTHPIHYVMESRYDDSANALGFSENMMKSRLKDKIEPDALHSDEVMLVILKEIERLGRLNEVFAARCPKTNDNLGHYLVSSNMDKSASFLCAKGIDHEAMNNKGETMLKHAHPLKRDTLDAMVRSHKAMQEANKVMDELYIGAGIK